MTASTVAGRQGAYTVDLLDAAVFDSPLISCFLFIPLGPIRSARRAACNLVAQHHPDYVVAMTVFLRRLITACILTFMSAMIHSSTDEYAMYGNMGQPIQNWQPRELAGWPAAFVADSPGTSVIHKIGIEDDFRPGAFVATLSFWYLVSLLLHCTASRFWRMYRGVDLRRDNSDATVEANRAKDQ